MGTPRLFGLSLLHGAEWAHGDQLANSAILGGDDTSCRVVEVSSYFAKVSKNLKKPLQPPWVSYRTAEAAEQTHADLLKKKEELLKRRKVGDREAKKA